ncbi:MAG: type I-C CRISPR-associated protein Cas5c [Rhodothermales bacterium]
MNDYAPLRVKVWGDRACFTRPEMKVERVSYEVMTPSAARGLLEAIYWKPEFRWRILRIHVLKPIHHVSILRNEVTKTISPGTVRNAFERGDGYVYFADDDRTQRHTLALRDVGYLIEAEVEPIGRGYEDHPAKHRDIFRRRVARGQCFHRPYLGCREFVADFAEPDGSEHAIDRTDDLGRMLFDLRYELDGGRNVPLFFAARLERGVLHVPQHLYDQTAPEVAAP